METEVFCCHAAPEFESRVETVVKKVINDQLRKLMVAVWVMTISGFFSLLAVGVAWGTLKTQVATNGLRDDRHQSDTNAHMTDTAKFNLFVTRSEWASVMSQQHETLKTFNDTLHRIESRMDQFSGAIKKP